ncbi:diaminopimelate epimerase [Candidatus Vidania fulgoroideae]|uniref:Diaminopimelate epimerase n=1 Tax=Candidatus Vidania fulgoroideorum TaxID=881286 RepID=A0A974XE70_9PROT|nr:diaminopimelate epimerase [Candidatus Vidania fulgoroideae]
MVLRFVKYSSYGNDFVITNDIDITIRSLYSRNVGIGFDQKISFRHRSKNVFICIIRNNDMTEASNCFNGIRCLSSYIYRKTKIRKIYVITKGGRYKFLCNKRNVKTIISQYKDNFLENMSFLYKKMFFRNICNIKQVNLLLTNIYFNYIDIGNLHLILFSTLDINNKLVFIRNLINNSDVFRNDVNISIFNTKYRKVFTYERGSGITLSCGTGTMASCLVYTLGISKKKLEILSDFGKLVFKKKIKHLSTIGFVNFSYSGKILVR